jgi:hypothetical protein
MNTALCYFRRPGSSWKPAPDVYQRVLSLYEEIQRDRRSRQPDPVTICTSGPDGSLFMAHLRVKPHTSGVFLCELGDESGRVDESGKVDESGSVIELMRCPVVLELGKKSQ